MNVAEIDVATKKLTWVTDLKWEANSGDFSPDGTQFTYEVNEDGRIGTYLADSATRRGNKINLVSGLNSYFGYAMQSARQGGRLLVEHQSSTQPGDLWGLRHYEARAPSVNVFRACQPDGGEDSSFATGVLSQLRRKNHQRVYVGTV